LKSELGRKIHGALERAFPEQRLFLRSETDETRFIRLSPVTQLFAWTGTSLFVAWSIIATAIILMDSIAAGNFRDQAHREQTLYENQLNALSTERNLQAEETLLAQERFNIALEQISKMQVALLTSEDRRKEMEIGLDVVQSTLRRTMQERDGARADYEVALAQIESGEELQSRAANADVESTVDFLTAALESTASERDTMATMAQQATAYVDELELERQLVEEKNNRIFAQLEDAVSLSMSPLDKMFSAAGMPTEQLLDTVRRGYSGQGGPLTPLRFSTRNEEPDADSLRANSILEKMDRLNLYRIAAQKVPFAMPLNSAFRLTSGFGPRWGRLHAGLDMAGPIGTPVYATADGVVTAAGTVSGYGRRIKIKHENGIETRFAHLNKIRVEVGQKVSRGDRIGDMGNSGRSTGSHLHYEVREDGEAVNPMTYIKAANDVF